MPRKKCTKSGYLKDDHAHICLHLNSLIIDLLLLLFRSGGQAEDFFLVDPLR